MVMRLMGATNISQITEKHILDENLKTRSGYKDYLSTGLYEPIKPIISKL